MATVYYNITYGDAPFSVRITGMGIDITEAVASTGVHLFTDLDDGTYVIAVTSFTGCVKAIEVSVACETTTTSTTAEPICDVYAEIVSLCDEVEPTTTTTSTTNLEPLIECLDGFVIEAIYMYTTNDYSLLPPEYVHPCYNTMGTHLCNRALFEVFGNGSVYVGDFRMNNNEGGGGGITPNSGNEVCRDYVNLPDALTGGYWGGSDKCRYDKITLTYDQALGIATATGGDVWVTFSMIPAMSSYSCTCDGQVSPHSNITWVRMTKSTGEVIYNGCPEGGFVTVDVCTGAVTTTTSTTIPVNTYFVYYDVL